MDPLIDVVVDRFGDAYPELRENEALVRQVAGSEEERFAATLRQGLVLFEEAKGRADQGRITGEDAFKLSDTFGFPVQLTEELAAEAGLTVDGDRFAELLEEQRGRARAAAKKVPIGLDAGAAPPSTFVGYDHLDADGSIVSLLDPEFRELQGAEEGEEVRVFLDRTPFYAEGGGQVGDRGLIRTPSGVIRVIDTVPAGDRSIVHTGVVESGEVRPGEEAHAEVDAERREATARAHTSTHIGHATLRELLGDHARQAGSLVEPGRLRFDFPHPSAVALDQLQEAELIANRRLARDDAPSIFETSMEEAKRLGAVMLFGEKYGDTVRVVEIGDYSRELCGGTHVVRTGNVGVIRLLHEGSIGAGMRRVEALVGPDALREINAERALLHDPVEAIGSTDPRSAIDHARKVIEENKRLRSELGKLQKGDRDASIASLVEDAQDVDGLALVVSEVPGEDASGLRELAQRVRDRLQGRPAAVVLGGGADGKAQLVAASTSEAVARGVTAPELLREAASVIGGGAGGKDILAMAGGRDASAISQALGGIPARARELLSAR
jgi:alanyl-tRNA synthetase